MDDIQHHSGFAPEQPRLHPKYYADEPPPADSARTALQLDHLFASEKFQRTYLRGLHSWMNGPIMRYVWFSQTLGLLPGGHQADEYGPISPGDAVRLASLINPPDPMNRAPGTGPAFNEILERRVNLINSPERVNRASGANPPLPGKPANGAYPVIDVMNETREGLVLKIFHAERIQVDESKWFSFLKRDRWLEWEKPEPLLDGGHWSVDNPKVWEILGISIELLDRILKALIADKHVMLVLHDLQGIARKPELANHKPPGLRLYCMV